MATCPTLSADAAFLSTLLRSIDCHGQLIGSAGYQALSDPGSPISIVLTGLLTIFIALFGLRMVLGETPSVRDGVIAVAKIGIVLVIATSWPAYRTVVYDVIVKGPAQLSAAIAGPSRLPGARGDLVAHLQISDDAITRLTTLGSGRNDLTSTAATDANGRPVLAERAPVTDDLAFGTARILFLSALVGAFAMVSLGAGVLLALAPLFAGLLLFGIRRGLLMGWARALVFTLLASVAVSIIVGVELALLEPWLTEVLRLRLARIVTPNAPIELLVLCLGFAIALAGVLGLLLRLCFTVNIDVGALSRAGRDATASDPVSEPAPRPARPAPESPSRALGVAGAVAAAQRREAAFRSVSVAGRAAAPAPGAGASASQGGLRTTVDPLRRRRPRKSGASALRDLQS